MAICQAKTDKIETSVGPAIRRPQEKVRPAIRRPQDITMGRRSAELELHKGNRNIGQKSDRQTQGISARFRVVRQVGGGGIYSQGHDIEALTVRTCHQALTLYHEIK